MRVLLLFSLIILSACLGQQAPAPVTHYGTSDGEGSAGVHSVIAGDTLWSISNRYKIAMRDIVQENDLSPPFSLGAGQRLKLPPPREYQVKNGDTLYAVSRIFDVGSSELARLNSLASPFTITPGQVLTLPSVAPAEVADISYAPVAKTVSPQRARTASAPASTKSASQVKPKSRITAKTPPRAGSKFKQPVAGKVVSGYGPKKGGLHNDGINIAAARGTSVAAAENGVVMYVGSELKGSGNLILVRHADRWMTAYAHLDGAVVERGQVVKRGQKIGMVGSTGSVTSPQLHFEVRRGTQAINPQRYIGG